MKSRHTRNKINQLVASSWLQKPLGKYLLTAEKNLLAKLSPKAFGYHMLLIGEPEFAICAKVTSINHKLLVSLKPVVDTELSVLCSRQDKLPIVSESVDVVYLAHAFDATNNPHEVIREAYRILRPEGQLILSWFNPWSIWGVWRIFARFSGKLPWKANFISNIKVKDWLCLLGFDIEHSQTYCYLPPINNEKFLAKMSFWDRLCEKIKFPFGAASLIICRKRMITLTPIKPKWQTQEVDGDLVEPSL